MGYGVPDSGKDFIYLSVRDAYMLMKNSKAVFVDSRDLPDYELSRLQTSFHLSANDLIFAKDKIDKQMVDHIISLSRLGKTIICLSDNCITGARNRGHVSRCRHIAQYFVELGADPTKVVRMAGGINEWKNQGLDGILGDLRTMYAGEIKEGMNHLSQSQSFALGAGEAAAESLGTATAARGTDPALELEGYIEEEVGEHAICARNLVAELLDMTQQKAPQAAGNASSGYNAAIEAPSAPVELKAGVSVRLHSLKGAPELNGQKGTCAEFNESSGRWVVTLESGEKKNVKPDNLEGFAPPASAVVVAPEKREPPPEISVVSGGDPGQEGGDTVHQLERMKLPVCRPLPVRENTPTAYRVLKGEIYKKPSKDSDKIVKLERPISAIVRTTGEVYQGTQGGYWAELDTMAGEKTGWVYIEGPGFGPTTRKIRTEFLRS